MAGKNHVNLLKKSAIENEKRKPEANEDSMEKKNSRRICEGSHKPRATFSSTPPPKKRSKKAQVQAVALYEE